MPAPEQPAGAFDWLLRGADQLGPGLWVASGALPSLLDAPVDDQPGRETRAADTGPIVIKLAELDVDLQAAEVVYPMVPGHLADPWGYPEPAPAVGGLLGLMYSKGAGELLGGSMMSVAHIKYLSPAGVCDWACSSLKEEMELVGAALGMIAVGQGEGGVAEEDYGSAAVTELMMQMTSLTSQLYVTKRVLEQVSDTGFGI